MPQKERPNERMAREIVAETLRVPVSCHDDNTQGSMVDALIHYPDGSLGAMEIVADHDDRFNKMWDALEKVGHSLPVVGLSRGWNVVLAHGADLRRVTAELPDLLRGMEALEQADLRPMSWGRNVELTDRAASLGVRMAYAVDHTPPGTVHLRAEGWSGFITTVSLADWVHDVLARHPRKLSKLLAHDGVRERHIFIWATVGSNFSIQNLLMKREQTAIAEQAAPNLAEGISHLWVAGSMSSQGGAGWSADRGWWWTRWRFPRGADDAD